jgi:hypothetical protein
MVEPTDPEKDFARWRDEGMMGWCEYGDDLWGGCIIDGKSNGDGNCIVAMYDVASNLKLYVMYVWECIEIGIGRIRQLVLDVPPRSSTLCIKSKKASQGLKQTKKELRLITIPYLKAIPPSKPLSQNPKS